MLITTVLFIASLITLSLGAKFLVSGAIELAHLLKISSLMIGLTVVSFGTSAPELAVSILAARKGEVDLLLGNVVGSNIFNQLFILGFCAACTPLVVSKQLIRWDVPVLIGVTLLFWGMAAFGVLWRWEGFLLFGGIVIYLIFLYFYQKKTPPKEPLLSPKRSTLINGLLVLLGLLLLWGGSELLISRAVMIAKFFNVSELLIGLTLVSIGTSIPELATSIAALRKGEKELVIGNVVGSSLFNLLAVMGLGVIFSPKPILVSKSMINFDLPVLVAISIALLPIFVTGHRVSRWEGFLFVAYYLFYLLYLYLELTAPLALPLFQSAFFLFILPLTLLTLGITIYRHLAKNQ